jgi:hypothetical protein
MEQQPPPEILPINFQRRLVYTVDSWPARTAFTVEWLTKERPPNVTVDGDTVTIYAHNGTAIYTLKHGEPMHGNGIVAELVEGEEPSALKRRVGKFENPAIKASEPV